MKKVTLISGLMSSFLFLLGATFKIMHWPGAGVALTLSIALFALGYSPLLMADKNKLTRNGYQKFVNMATMLIMLLVSGSFLFKAMHWPGTGVLVRVTSIFLIVMIPVLFIHALKEPDPVKKLNFHNEAILLAMLAVFSLFLWLN